jgi:hypothetical protein
MITPRDLDVQGYDESPAAYYRVTTAGGGVYRVVLAQDVGLALIQREGCPGWIEVRLDDLRVADGPRLQLAAAAIDATLAQ